MSKEAPTPNPIEARFQDLADQYKHDVAHDLNDSHYTSSARDEILRDGQSFLPFIIEDLTKEPTLWLPLLPRLTGANPVQQKHLGNMNRMRDDWREWHKNQVSEGQSKGTVKFSPQTA